MLVLDFINVGNGDSILVRELEGARQSYDGNLMALYKRVSKRIRIFNSKQLLLREELPLLKISSISPSAVIGQRSSMTSQTWKQSAGSIS